MKQEIEERQEITLENSDARASLFAALDAGRQACLHYRREYVPTSQKGEVLSGAAPNYISRDDIASQDKKTFFTILSDQFIKFQATMDMKLSKEERKACQLGLRMALDADISKSGQVEYRMRQLNEILNQFESIILLGCSDERVIRGLYHKTKELDKLLPILDLDEMTYDSCSMYIASIRKKLAQKLFNLKLEEVKGYQRQKTRKN